MDKINNIGLSRMITSTYDFDGFTEQEIWCRIAQKINIIIEHYNYIDNKIELEKENNKNKFDYLLNNGLNECIAKEMIELVENGTLKTIVNDILVNDINIKINSIISMVEDVNKRLIALEESLRGE